MTAALKFLPDSNICVILMLMSVDYLFSFKWRFFLILDLTCNFWFYPWNFWYYVMRLYILFKSVFSKSPWSCCAAGGRSRSSFAATTWGWRSRLPIWWPLDPGKTEVPAHYLVLSLCVHAQLCPTLGDAMYCNPPDSSVHGIFQARILECVAISSSKGSSKHRDQAHISCISCIADRFFIPSVTWETHPTWWSWDCRLPARPLLTPPQLGERGTSPFSLLLLGVDGSPGSLWVIL